MRFKADHKTIHMFMSSAMIKDDSGHGDAGGPATAATLSTPRRRSSSSKVPMVPLSTPRTSLKGGATVGGIGGPGDADSPRASQSAKVLFNSTRADPSAM